MILQRLRPLVRRVLLPALTGLLFAASLLTLGPVVYRTDSGAMIGGVAELRSMVFDVGAAADGAQISGDRTAFDAAVSELEAHWRSLEQPVDSFLGSEAGAPNRVALDAAIHSFVESAGDYAAGTVDADTAGARFDAAVGGVDVLMGALTERSSARGANVRALEIGGSILLLATAATAGLGIRLWRRDLQSRIQHDATTGLLDRPAFLQRLGAAIERSSDASVLFINLDRFALFNESLGHRGGDALLAAVAKRLSESLPWDHVLARFGGDEFLALIPAESNVSPEDSAGIVRRAFGPPFMVDGETLHVTASIGASSADESNDPERIVREAQAAMEHARRNRGGQIEPFDRARAHTGPDRLRLEAELRQAIKLDQLALHYQPVFRATDGEIESFEALLRWEHPERGLVRPDEFIPVLEQSGLIVEVGTQVLQAACVQTAMWAEAGLGRFRIAVNVSAHQLLVPGFADTVREVLATSGLPPDLLELEITETTAIE